MTGPSGEIPDLLFGVGATGDDQGPDRNHYPLVRALHVGWRRDVTGQWVADARDDQHWEVVCTQCGDTDGPAEQQTPPVQKLRGPYRSKHQARHAASKHFKQWAAPQRWMAGSAFPEKM